MLNVLHIVGSTNFGGVQVYLLDLSKYDESLGIKRKLLCTQNVNGKLKSSFIINGVDCIACTIMPQDKGRRPYRLWKFIRKKLRFLFLIKLIRKFKIIKPDIIICDEPHNLTTQLLVSMICKIPFIWHIHNENQFKNVNIVLLKLYLNYFSLNRLSIITDSKYIFEKNIKKLGFRTYNFLNRPYLMPASPDLKNFFSYQNDKPIDKNVINIGTVGRLVPEKSYDILIEIIFSLQNKTDKVIKLTIVGDGPLKEKLKDLVKDFNLKKSITFIDNIRREDMAEFYSSLNIYAQTSSTEGSPLTIKEAMAASLPIISTNVGGISEILENNKSGILVKANDIDDFVSELLKMLNMNLNSFKILGNNAREYAKKNFSIEDNALNYYKLYKKKIEEK